MTTSWAQESKLHEPMPSQATLVNSSGTDCDHVRSYTEIVNPES